MFNERPDVAQLEVAAEDIADDCCVFVDDRKRTTIRPVAQWRYPAHSHALESFVTKARDKAAALNFMKKAIKRHRTPEAITFDGLRSYKAAISELGCEARHEVGRWPNNRVENSHLPFRRRERAMLRFRRMKSLQKFSSLHANVHNHFNAERHPR